MTRPFLAVTYGCNLLKLLPLIFGEGIETDPPECTVPVILLFPNHLLYQPLLTLVPVPAPSTAVSIHSPFLNPALGVWLKVGILKDECVGR